MNLGMVCDRQAHCLICGYEYNTDSDDKADTELREHLHMVHSRFLVSRDDKFNKATGLTTREFLGVRYKYDLGVGNGR